MVKVRRGDTPSTVQVPGPAGRDCQHGTHGRHDHATEQVA